MEFNICVQTLKTKLLAGITASLLAVGFVTTAHADDAASIQDAINSTDQQLQNDAALTQTLPSSIEKVNAIITELATAYNVDMSTDVYGRLVTPVLEQTNIPSMIRGMIEDQINARQTLQRSVGEVQNRIQQNTVLQEQRRQALAQALANPPAPAETVAPTIEPLVSAQTDVQPQPVESVGTQTVEPQTVAPVLPDIIQPTATQTTEGHRMKTALRINTDFTTEVIDLSTDSYEKMSGAVGGLIQPVDLRDDLVLWCNEEGKLIDGMQPNIIGTHLWEKSFGMTDVIMGNILITGGYDGEGDNLPLSQAWIVQLQELAEQLKAARLGEATIIDFPA